MPNTAPLPVQGAAESAQALVQEVGRQCGRQVSVHLNVNLRVAPGQALLRGRKGVVME